MFLPFQQEEFAIPQNVLGPLEKSHHVLGPTLTNQICSDQVSIRIALRESVLQRCMISDGGWQSTGIAVCDQGLPQVWGRFPGLTFPANLPSTIVQPFSWYHAFKESMRHLFNGIDLESVNKYSSIGLTTSTLRQRFFGCYFMLRGAQCRYLIAELDRDGFGIYKA